MNRTEPTLARLRRFALPVDPALPAVDEALPALYALLADAGVEFKIVGGVAVVHHGYARTTEDIDVLVASQDALDPALAAHGFERPSAHRLRHVATAVVIDLLVAGAPLPREGAGAYPSPAALAGSPRDDRIVGLPGLVELKVRARRHRDLADVVELLKLVDDGKFDELEAAIPAALRSELAGLRRDALEEASAAVR